MATRTGRGAREAEAVRNDRALLDAARDVFAVEGAQATVASIAARAGVGIGTLYRRYSTKDELLQELCRAALDDWTAAARAGLADDDPWAGLAGFVAASVETGAGSLGPIAGTVAVTPEMDAASRESDEAIGALVRRAHDAGALRADVNDLDIIALIVQLGKRDRLYPTPSELNARARVVAIAVAGLRAGRDEPLPGTLPGPELYAERWTAGSTS